MSWDDTVKGLFLCDGTGCCAGAIAGTQGEGLWGKTDNFEITNAEVQAMISQLASKSSTKLKIAGKEYMVIKTDDDAILLRKGTEGAAIVKTATSLCIGVHDDKIQTQAAFLEVSRAADYIKTAVEAVTHYTMSKRLSTQRSLAAALSNENTSAAPAAASPTGPEGSGATSQALVVAQPPAEPASPAASPEPKRSRSAEPSWTELDFVAEASQPGFLDTLNPERILVCVFYGTHASLLALCKQLFNQGRLFDPRWVRLASFDIIPSLHRPFLQQFALFSLLGRSIGELWPPKPLTTTLTESSLRSLLKEVLEEHLRDIDQRLKDNAIAIEVLQNTAGLTAQAVKDIAAKPAPAGLAGDAPPITTWADMLKQHTTSTTSAVAAQLQRQTLDLREEAELAQRSLNVIVKNFTMEEGETSEKLLRAFEREILGRMGLIGEIALAAHRLPRARGKAGPPPLLLTFKTPADKISFLRRRKRLEKTLFTLDDDLTLAQQQRRRELWPIYLQLRQTKAGQPVYWKGAAIYRFSPDSALFCSINDKVPSIACVQTDARKKIAAVVLSDSGRSDDDDEGLWQLKNMRCAVESSISTHRGVADGLSWNYNVEHLQPLTFAFAGSRVGNMPRKFEKEVRHFAKQLGVPPGVIYGVGALVALGTLKKTLGLVFRSERPKREAGASTSSKKRGSAHEANVDLRVPGNNANEGSLGDIPSAPEGGAELPDSDGSSRQISEKVIADGPSSAAADHRIQGAQSPLTSVDADDQLRNDGAQSRGLNGAAGLDDIATDVQAGSAETGSADTAVEDPAVDTKAESFKKKGRVASDVKKKLSKKTKVKKVEVEPSEGVQDTLPSGAASSVDRDTDEESDMLKRTKGSSAKGTGLAAELKAVRTRSSSRPKSRSKSVKPHRSPNVKRKNSDLSSAGVLIGQTELPTVDLILKVVGGPAEGIEVQASVHCATVGSLSIGRVSRNDLVLDDAEVSAKHARIEWSPEDKAWLLVDLGSLNGTMVEGKLISNPVERRLSEAIVLEDGNVLSFGTTSKILVRLIQTEVPVLVDVEPAKVPCRVALRQYNGIGRNGQSLPMEDESVCIWPLRPASAVAEGTPQFGLFCVFDGHCGRAAAELARSLFPGEVTRFLAQAGAVDKILRTDDATKLLQEAFAATDKAIRVELAGCTATAGLLWEKNNGSNKVYFQVANVGDSACVFSKGGKATKLTVDHRLTDPQERQRLAAEGIVLKEGEYRLYGLNLARALGDKLLKSENLGLVADPDVSATLEITRGRGHFVIMASDGLWDVAKPAQAVDIATKAINEDKDSPVEEVVATALIEHCKKLRAADNVTIIVISFP
eukprot:jgi/Mesvir1/1459/Mv14445-RA.1